MSRPKELYRIPFVPFADRLRAEGFPIFVTERGVIWKDIDNERMRQDEKWGPQTHPNGTGSLEQQKNAVYYRNITDYRDSQGVLTWADILAEEFAEAMAETDHYALREELIQTIAVAVAWIEDLDKQVAKEAVGTS